MNDLRYGQLLNPNRLLKLVLMRVEIIRNFFRMIDNFISDLMKQI